MSYLPLQLEYFYLNITTLNLYDCIERIEELSVQFMERFRIIRGFDIYFMDKLMHYTIQPSIVSDITIYFTLVNALLGGQEAYCIFKADSIKAMSNRFTLDSNNTLILEYGINELDLFLNEHHKGNMHIPDKRISTTGFEIINRFSYLFQYNDLFFDRPVEDKYDMPRIIFEYVLLNCPNLDHLEIEGCEINGSKINVGPRKGVIAPRPTKNGHQFLKVVKLSNIYNHTRILEPLLTYLSDMEILSCYYIFHCPRLNTFDSYDTDLTGFESFFFLLLLKAVWILATYFFTSGTQTARKKMYGFDVAKNKITPLVTCHLK
ncbi:hypothetical protein HPULCUR_006974 [Helicostylum pulchrum]|uniref:Uncharacterized protein n=1 Tax=Helicostylum pulchrum TaxID=562976 RepID=A0ABP9Y3E0_9FUNG